MGPLSGAAAAPGSAHLEEAGDESLLAAGVVPLSAFGYSVDDLVSSSGQANGGQQHPHPHPQHGRHSVPYLPPLGGAAAAAAAAAAGGGGGGGYGVVEEGAEEGYDEEEAVGVGEFRRPLTDLGLFGAPFLGGTPRGPNGAPLPGGGVGGGGGGAHGSYAAVMAQQPYIYQAAPVAAAVTQHHQ